MPPSRSPVIWMPTDPCGAVPSICTLAGIVAERGEGGSHPFAPAEMADKQAIPGVDRAFVAQFGAIVGQ